ncbi:MAG: IS30 family transposase [Marmoricola sp.]
MKLDSRQAQSSQTAGHLLVNDAPEPATTHGSGSEHVRLTIQANLPVYFCDPHSPWQRGTNENTNGLLRQYFPKGTDLSVHSPAELARVAAGLNGRPRKTLGSKTPAEAFAALLSAAA